MSTNLHDAVLRTLECIDPNISSNEWRQCLCKIDDDVMAMHSKSDHIVIISLPYKLNEIMYSIQEFISNTFNDESLLFCCDIIIQFIIPNKHIIQQKIERNNKCNNDKWRKNKYDELISTESLIVLNTLNCDYISIPRAVHQINCSWKISWNHYDKNNIIYSEINENICNKIGNIILSSHFELSEDWTQRIDFTDIRLVGYLCDDGEVIRGDMLRQQPGKIFVHFNTDGDHYGRKWDWISVPNDRICPPPKTRPKQREMTTYSMSGNHRYNNMSHYTYNNRSRTIPMYNQNKEDDDLQRAIAASLLDIRPTNNSKTSQNEQDSLNEDTEDDEDFLQQAINGASQD